MNYTTNSTSLFEKAYSPALQGLLVFIAVFFVMVGGKLINSMGIMEISNEFPWLTSASFMLFFAIFNSVFSLAAKDINHYWGRSMLSFAGLAIGTGFLAYFFSSISLEETGAYKWIYVVLTFGYLVFLSIMGFMKRIVDFAEKEDWQAPRKKKR